jgi:class 3 adenylate cyclase/tetratricopeptide (TPR) repeat protein
MAICPNCRFNNTEGARFCNNCGSPLEAPRSIEGERKFATVLFSDVARSTEIAERLDPEDWALIMNGAFGFMNAAVSRYGGTVSRLMGDAVLALFGAPVAHEDDAERAVRAGLDIQEAAATYARSVKERYGVEFALRVGINTGTAVLAFVGDSIRTEYTAMGDAANVAARLQSAAEPGTVLISADTHRLVKAQFEFRPRGEIAMKGKQTPVGSFEVLSVRAVRGNARGLEGLTSPMIGRDKELNLLRERFAALARGHGSVVTILGEAGLGKSRLVAELRELHASEPDSRVAWYESRAISFGQSTPYFPWRQLGRRIVGATEVDGAAAVRAKLAAFVARIGLAQRDVPFLETMLAVDTEDSRRALADLPGEAVVNGVANAVVTAIRALMRSDDGLSPHVLVMDDLHWSDNATLELIAQVATLASVDPLLIICVLRPDRSSVAWSLVDRLQASLGATFLRIDLEPLDSAHSGTLLGNLLHIEDLPATIREQIVERSEGNPFYLEEVLRSLIDCGQVVRENGHWRATHDIVDATIPETLAGVLSSRIDRLPDTTKRVAQTAAVIGREFLHRVLEAVCRAETGAERVENVEPHIGTLRFEQLVRDKAREPEREYIFKHAMTCEAAYGLLLRSRRRELHARAGAALESLYADRRDEFAPILARHFAEADDPKRAIYYSQRAATSARKLYALREELEHRERILVMLEGLPNAVAADLVDAALEWAFVRHKLNRYEGVTERLEAAVAAARGTDDKTRLASALSWIGNIHIVTGFPSRAVPYLMESQALATELGNEYLLLLPMFMATESLVDRDPGMAAVQFGEIVELARKHRVPEVEIHALAFRAVALARLGDYRQARAVVEEALEAAPRAGSPVKEADIHIAAAMAYYDMGEIDTGIKHARIGAEMALGANGIECACAGFFTVGRGQLELRRLEDALQEFGKSLRLADFSGWEGFVNMIRGGVAVAEFEKGSPTAVAQLETAVSNARSSHDHYADAVLSEQLARALLKGDRPEEAAPRLATALEYFRDRKMLPYVARALEVQADIEDRRGRSSDSERLRDESRSLRAQFELQPSDSGGRAAATI